MSMDICFAGSVVKCICVHVFRLTKYCIEKWLGLRCRSWSIGCPLTLYTSLLLRCILPNNYFFFLLGVSAPLKMDTSPSYLSHTHTHVHTLSSSPFAVHKPFEYICFLIPLNSVLSVEAGLYHSKLRGGSFKFLCTFV